VFVNQKLQQKVTKKYSTRTNTVINKVVKSNRRAGVCVGTVSTDATFSGTGDQTLYFWLPIAVLYMTKRCSSYSFTISQKSATVLPCMDCHVQSVVSAQKYLAHSIHTGKVLSRTVQELYALAPL